MKKADGERWISNENEEEIHYFVKDKRNTYVFGYNPKYMKKKKAEELLNDCGVKAPSNLPRK